MKFLLTDKEVHALVEKVGELDIPASIDLKLSTFALVVTISKFGTTTLRFSLFPSSDVAYPGKEVLELIAEDVAWLHKKYIPQVKAKIRALVTEVGGTILA